MANRKNQRHITPQPAPAPHQGPKAIKGGYTQAELDSRKFRVFESSNGGESWRTKQDPTLTGDAPQRVAPQPQPSLASRPPRGDEVAQAPRTWDRPAPIALPQGPIRAASAPRPVAPPAPPRAAPPEPLTHTFANGVTLIIKVGDLLAEPADALVNAANDGLWAGGGVCGALHEGAGPGLAQECRAIIKADGNVLVGAAVITTAGDLPNQYIIHAVGPMFEVEEAYLLELAYKNSLELAETAELTSIAFPVLSSGIYRFPTEEAVQGACIGIRDFFADGHASTIKTVTIAMHDAKKFPAARRAFQSAFGPDATL